MVLYAEWGARDAIGEFAIRHLSRGYGEKFPETLWKKI